jgi:hypothetical protein
MRYWMAERLRRSTPDARLPPSAGAAACCPLTGAASRRREETPRVQNAELRLSREDGQLPGRGFPRMRRVPMSTLLPTARFMSQRSDFRKNLRISGKSASFQEIRGLRQSARSRCTCSSRHSQDGFGFDSALVCEQALPDGLERTEIFSRL